MEKEDSTEKSRANSTSLGKEGDASDISKENPENRVPVEQHVDDNRTYGVVEENVPIVRIDEQVKESAIRKNAVESLAYKNEEGTTGLAKGEQGQESPSEEKNVNSPPCEKSEKEIVEVQKEPLESLNQLGILNISEKTAEAGSKKASGILDEKESEVTELEAGNSEGTTKNLEEIHYEEEPEPVFDGTEVPGMDADNESETHGYAWPEKAVAVKNFVKQKSAVAVSSFLRRLSGKSNDGQDGADEEHENNISNKDGHEASPKPVERSGWNPLSLIGISREADAENKDQYVGDAKVTTEMLPMKGRIMLYTRIGCQDCKEARLFLHKKRLRYVEINIDLYPGRKLELEKFAGSSAVPRVFFNEVLIGGLSELKSLDESGKLEEKIEYVISEVPSFEAPMPPLSGEDDLSSSGSIDELALIAGKMKENLVVKDRFYKMRRFTNCFLGSEAVDFLSEDQYLEREEVSYFFISPFSKSIY